MPVLAGRYRLDEIAGSGGMAVVWQAYDLVLRRKVAVKLLVADATDGPSEDAVRREALAAAQLCHPHIAGIHDYGETEHHGHRQQFLVMEYVDGPTLAAHLAGTGALRWRDAVAVCRQVAEALAVAHDDALVHRDVKPGNVMLSPTGVKVVDFGVAAGAGDEAADADGRIWGTPGYLAPEQLKPGPALPAGDVYALGLLLFECLTGHPPWRSVRVDDVLAERRRDPLPELPGQDELPEELLQLYRRCLASSPADRPPASVVAEILRTLEGPVPVVRPQRPAAYPEGSSPQATRADTRSARPRRVAALIGAPLAAVAGIVAWQLAGGNARQPAAQAQPPETGRTVEAACKAEYASLRLPDGSFTARLAVTNNGAHDLRDWSVRYLVPLRQRVTAVTGARWSQESRAVTLTSADRLPVGARTAITVHGTFDQQQSGVPGTFSVDGVTCAQAVTRVQTSFPPRPARTVTAESGTGGRGASDKADETKTPFRTVPTSSPPPLAETTTSPPSSAQPPQPAESSSAPTEPPVSSEPGDEMPEPSDAPEPTDASDQPAPPGPSDAGGSHGTDAVATEPPPTSQRRSAGGHGTG